ncbi:MAG: T9SS type A sorting domain-containing protein [Paludibacteraceae bacterium]|nr:T9SS type A sorting domain-containing protein [Paludibacteraceae bacterium]
MKKLTLLTCVFCLSAFVYAANPTDDPHQFCDFESTTALPASGFHAPDGGGTVSFVDNPYKTGINTSAKVLKVISPAGANWGGCIFNEVSQGETNMNALYGVTNNCVIGYDIVSIMMYREDNTSVPQLKTVDVDDDGRTGVNYLDLKPYSVDGEKNYEAKGTIQTGKWQEYVYSVTHCHNSGIKFIYIMPDRTGQSTVYVDNIVFKKDIEKPVMGTATCGGSSSESITLRVTATDNLSNPVNHFMVSTNGSLASATDLLANSGNLTITGLEASTSYTFTIWAKDYAGNVSDNSVTVTCNTSDPQASNYCHKEVIAGGHTVYFSCSKEGANKYVFVIESEDVMTGISAGCYCYVNGMQSYQYGATDKYTVSDGGKKITCNITSTDDPRFYTPVYVLFPGEVSYPQPTDIIWGVCKAPEPCVGPSGGWIQWPNLQYSRGAHPYDIEFSAVYGTDLQFEWHYNTTGTINPADPIYPGEGWNKQNLNPPTDVVGRTYYWCRIYNDCGSINSDIANVDIIECMLGNISISGSSTVVEGNALSLTMNYVDSNGGYKTVSWYKDGTLIQQVGWPTDSIHNVHTLTINPCALSDGGCYYCVMQDGVNCTRQSNQICVNVTPGVTPPTPTTIDHPAVDLCLGSSMTIKGGNVGPWTWDNGATTQSITVFGNTLGTVHYTCTTTAQIDKYTINVIDCSVPCENLIYSKWDDVLFVDNGDSIFVNYQWYRDGQALEGETKQYYYTSGESMQGDGHEYHAVAFKADGSSVVACPYLFEGFDRSADKNPGERQPIVIYPNPVRSNMPIQIHGMGEELQITVYSVLGQRVAVYTDNSFVVNLPTGQYILQVLDSTNEPQCQLLIVE